MSIYIYIYIYLCISTSKYIHMLYLYIYIYMCVCIYIYIAGSSVECVLEESHGYVLFSHLYINIHIHFAIAQMSVCAR